MGNHKALIKRSLEIHLQRGIQAKAALQDNDWNAADALMGLRRASFENTRSLLWHAERSGTLVDLKETFNSLLLQIDEVDAEIAELMVKMKSELTTELHRSQRSRTQMMKYQSGRRQPPGFVFSA